ncbi:hypothetical protein [Pinirhizobacter sp.]|uniref:hypothetical protein n=1 Tax=Pinirhizobacter sp. TaxID=2950432 RepID=UPI002F3ED641
MGLARRIAGAVFLLLLLALGLAAWGRFRAPSAAERDALELLRVDSTPLPAKNAWHALWLLDYIIPAGEREAAYAQDLAQLRDRAVAVRAGTPVPPFRKWAENHYAALPKLTDDDRAAICRPVSQCLAQVRTHPEATRLALTRHADRLAAIAGLAGMDYLWNDMPPVTAAPGPDIGDVQALWLTAAASDFVEGRQQEGLAQACTSALTMRRLHVGGNDALGSMITARWAIEAGGLAMDMLAQMPDDAPVPAICAAAFAPPVDADVDFCEVSRAQWRGSFGSVENFPVVEHGAGGASWLLSRDQTRRLAAPAFVAACKADVRAAELADAHLDDAIQPRPTPDFIDRIGNVQGVDLAVAGVPNFVPYLRRNRDYAATLRMFGTALWLRTLKGDYRTLAARVAARPASVNPPGSRPIKAGPDGISLVMDLYAPVDGERVTTVPLPVPAS